MVAFQTLYFSCWSTNSRWDLNLDCFLATREGRFYCYPEKFLQLWNGGKGRHPAQIFDNCELVGEILASLRAFARILAHL